VATPVAQASIPRFTCSIFLGQTTSFSPVSLLHYPQLVKSGLLRAGPSSLGVNASNDCQQVARRVARSSVCGPKRVDCVGSGRQKIGGDRSRLWHRQHLIRKDRQLRLKRNHVSGTRKVCSHANAIVVVVKRSSNVSNIRLRQVIVSLVLILIDDKQNLHFGVANGVGARIQLVEVERSRRAQSKLLHTQTKRKLKRTNFSSFPRT
jgi:hypothetical protein